MKKAIPYLSFITLLLLSQLSLPIDTAFSFGDAYFTENTQYIYIGNQHLELMFQKSDGELYGIKHKATGTEFIKEKNAWWSPYAFVYYTNNHANHNIHGCISNSFSHSSRTITDGVALDLYWNGFTVDNSTKDIQVAVTIEVKDNSPLSQWAITITNNEDITIEAVDFPTLSGLGQISLDSEKDYMVYPSTSGLLFQNPLSNFIQDKGWGWEMYYPSAYSTMQFLAYYGMEPAAGLYIASYDPDGNSKYFNFTKPNNSWLYTDIKHIPEFVKGADYKMNYPVVLGVFSGDWYDAAQLYRMWALEQPWTAQGTLETRSDIPSWYSSSGLRIWIYTRPLSFPDYNPFSLVPEVISDTATYFGHPSIANWIGWERQGWYLEYPDVFPPKEGWDAFRKAISEIHESGNRVLFLPGVAIYSSLAPSWSSAQAFACRDRFGNYSNPFNYLECGITSTFYKMCPATSYWKDTLESMLSTLSQEGADVIQLDGFPTLGPQPCMDTGHGHPKGGGSWWHDNYQQIFGDFKANARQTNPDLALSSEGMAETYIPLLDNFWDPFTTGWSPNSVSAVFNDASKVQLIPLWHAVYHDYTFLESGITFIACRSDDRDFYIRGFGLSLIWGEMPDIWCPDDKISALDEQARDMADYLRRIVEARINYAKPYLMYGRMLRPPNLNVPVFRISGAKEIPYSLDDYPPFDSPSVLSSVWKAPDDSVGYIFTNISHDTVDFALTISPSDVLLSSDDKYYVIENRNGLQSTLLTSVHLPQVLSIQIKPQDVLLVKVVLTPIFTDMIIVKILPQETNFRWQQSLSL